MLNRLKFLRRLAADPLRWGVWANELRKLRLEVLQLAHLRVVLGIAAHWIVEDVIAVVVQADFATQFLNAQLCFSVGSVVGGHWLPEACGRARSRTARRAACGQRSRPSTASGWAGAGLIALKTVPVLRW